MSEQQQCHQLNGYKYSFNRNNPYLQKIISETQSNNLPLLNTSLQSAHQTPSFISTKQLIINPNKQPSSIIKTTRSMFYNKHQQNQKNKILIDLYLRKTKLSRIKQSSPQKRTQRSLLKHRLNRIHSQQQQFIQQAYLTQRKDYNNNKRSNNNNSKPIIHRHSSTTSNHQITHNNTQQQLYRDGDKDERIIRSNNDIANKIRNKKSSNTSNELNKVYRNMSENKFNVYLASPRQYAKVKPASITSNIAPLQKISKFTTSIQGNNKDSNNNTSNKMNALIKQNNKKQLFLRINTQGSLDRYVNNRQSTQYTSFIINNNTTPSHQMSITTASHQMSIVKNKYIAIKYKSPKLLLSSRNKHFKTKKQTPKIQLFTPQQQQSIIKQFYNSSK